MAVGDRRIDWWGGAALVLIAIVSVAGNAAFTEPPRYDGAGYAILARSLLERGDYREIDHPDAPRHAHFPPGYPGLLAATWGVSGASLPAAHAASAVATVAAVLLIWAWFRHLYRPEVALGLGLALALNWTWGRVGGAIQSEPWFLLGSALVFLGAWEARTKGGARRALVVGGLLGAVILIRHVGVALAAAVLLDLVLAGRRREAILALVVALIVVAPWAAWTRIVGGPTQADLLPESDWAGVLRSNALFYVRRLPDVLWGPVIEVGTVFRPDWRRPATLAASVVSGLILGGWLRTLRTRRRRLAGLVAVGTLALLAVWPFTEAGRFLIPLAPLILVGGLEALAAVGGTLGLARPRLKAAWLLAALSLPYTGYALATGRARAARDTHAGFDRACAWLASAGADRPGPVLSRHPGEVFWRTGRTGIAASEPGDIPGLVDRYGVAYLLIDEDRFARAPTSPLARFAADRPDAWPVVWSGPGIEIRGRSAGP